MRGKSQFVNITMRSKKYHDCDLLLPPNHPDKMSLKKVRVSGVWEGSPEKYQEF